MSEQAANTEFRSNTHPMSVAEYLASERGRQTPVIG